MYLCTRSANLLKKALASSVPRSAQYEWTYTRDPCFTLECGEQTNGDHQPSRDCGPGFQLVPRRCQAACSFQKTKNTPVLQPPRSGFETFERGNHVVQEPTAWAARSFPSSALETPYWPEAKLSSFEMRASEVRWPRGYSYVSPQGCAFLCM
ncbi:LAQU0S22e00122g1_1 [Lachancea quebecensis]|uniref:LAQU0S22e00122g1_1 n=1 Tax=Lachancea quebecensis TaxID=1654605 RepID=A0A0P1KYA7_9SACH|nr:LAQU0S22e00122g1_1 [Lachancea quebecensis]